MKPQSFRTLIPLLVLVICGGAFIVSANIGTLSAIGWQDISVLCPLGALGTMLASKTFVPRALISLVIAIIAIILLGRAFCGWICPVPFIGKLRTAFAKKKDEQLVEVKTAEQIAAEADENANRVYPSDEELKLPKTGCAACTKACNKGDEPANSRHMILGFSLLSAAIFGFPVFCLICPIGLSFAFIFILVLLFSGGDVTWSVVIIPVLLLVEVVFFRKWCSHICPLSSLMSLVGKLNRTWRPTVKKEKCVETAGGACGRCAQVCEVGINPRHPEEGVDFSECLKCHKCVEVCPSGALKMPFLAPKDNDTPKAEEAPATTALQE